MSSSTAPCVVCFRSPCCFCGFHSIDFFDFLLVENLCFWHLRGLETVHLRALSPEGFGGFISGRIPVGSQMAGRFSIWFLDFLDFLPGGPVELVKILDSLNFPNSLVQGVPRLLRVPFGPF